MSIITIHHCNQCGSDWRGRKAEMPVQCPRCKSLRWDRATLASRHFTGTSVLIPKAKPDAPVLGEIIERGEGISLEYDGEAEVPELAEPRAEIPVLPAHVAGKVTLGFGGRPIPTAESRKVVRPVTNPKRTE